MNAIIDWQLWDPKIDSQTYMDSRPFIDSHKIEILKLLSQRKRKKWMLIMQSKVSLKCTELIEKQVDEINKMI